MRSGSGGVVLEASPQDVFGNPMMLSMLLCYLQTTAKTKSRGPYLVTDMVRCAAFLLEREPVHVHVVCLRLP